MSDPFSDTFNTAIWAEQAEDDNPFAAQKCICRGYDVYGDLLGKAGFIEYLYLLFKGERPAAQHAAALNLIAIALANPGPRDPSVHAAMAAYVSGTPAATALVAALSVGAGSYQGAREILLAIEIWQACGTDLEKWRKRLSHTPAPTRTTIWPHRETPAGFDPWGVTCAKPVQQTLTKLLEQLPDGHLRWLADNRLTLEAATTSSSEPGSADSAKPLNLFGVIAAALVDLDFSAAEAEMLVLLLRLPGAAVHALEQKQRGFRQFPFFALDLASPETLPTPAEAV